jgi:hypothetical protein
MWLLSRRRRVRGGKIYYSEEITLPFFGSSSPKHSNTPKKKKSRRKTKATQTNVRLFSFSFSFFFFFFFLFFRQHTRNTQTEHRTHAFGIAATVRDHRRCDHCYWWHPIRRARVTHGET